MTTACSSWTATPSTTARQRRRTTGTACSVRPANKLITPDPVNGPLLADVFVSDAAVPDQTYFQSNKDIQPIASGAQHWGCDPINNPLNKDDLQNAYAALIQVPANAPDNAGDQVLYLGSERGSNNGTSFAGFWLLKDKNVGCYATNDFSGQHTDGDLLIVSDYTNGGGTQDVPVYKWSATTPPGVRCFTRRSTGRSEWCSATTSVRDRERWRDHHSVVAHAPHRQHLRRDGDRPDYFARVERRLFHATSWPRPVRPTC